jgi:hypothetical protein
MTAWEIGIPLGTLVFAVAAVLFARASARRLEQGDSDISRR